jgi:hypothetical protein
MASPFQNTSALVRLRILSIVNYLVWISCQPNAEGYPKAVRAEDDGADQY